MAVNSLNSSAYGLTLIIRFSADLTERVVNDTFDILEFLSVVYAPEK